MPGTITRFFIWWRDELTSFVPQRLRRCFRRQRSIVLAELRDDRLVLNQVRGARTGSLGEVPLARDASAAARDAVQRALKSVSRKGAVIALDLPADAVLSRRIAFPAAAAENLRQVAAYEMSRRTPFKPDEVYFDVRIVERTPDGEQIGVDLHIVPRETVDSAIEKAAALGLRPQRVGVAGDALSAAHGINLLPVAPVRASRTEAIVAAVLAIAAVGLLFAAVAIPLERKRAHATRLADAVTALRKEAMAGEKLSAEIERLGTRNRFIANRKQMGPSALAVVKDLTELLPDDTWLSNMTLVGDQVSIQGYADAASTLVELIESSPRFRNAALQSRLTRDRQTGLERFQITFNIELVGD
jgi:general secretion pathway protein L